MVRVVQPSELLSLSSLSSHQCPLGSGRTLARESPSSRSESEECNFRTIRTASRSADRSHVLVFSSSSTFLPLPRFPFLLIPLHTSEVQSRDGARSRHDPAPHTLCARRRARRTAVLSDGIQIASLTLAQAGQVRDKGARVDRAEGKARCMED